MVGRRLVIEWSGGSCPRGKVTEGRSDVSECMSPEGGALGRRHYNVLGTWQLSNGGRTEGGSDMCVCMPPLGLGFRWETI